MKLDPRRASRQNFRHPSIWLWIALFLLTGCTQTTPPPALPSDTAPAPIVSETPSPVVSASTTLTPSPAPSSSTTASETPTVSGTATLPPTTAATSSPTAAVTFTATAPATATSSPAPTLTPTRDFPDVVVKEQANCRYGPGVAYLYRWGLYAGDPAEVHGRNAAGNWYWIKPANLDSHCWASEIVFEERIDAQQVPLVQARLPKTTFAGPPNNVQAVRSGDQVTISWDVVILSDDKRRGYMLEASLCQNGAFFFQAYRTDELQYTFTDQAGCAGQSGALLYTAEKHGYSDPVQIAWP